MKMDSFKAFLKKARHKLANIIPFSFANRYSETQVDYRALDQKDILCREPEQDLLQYMLGASSLAIDVGANTGTYIKSILETGASCLAIECNPSLCKVLQIRFAGNPKVQVKSLALSNSAGFAWLRTPRIGGLEQDGYSSIQLDFNEAEHVKRILVRKKRLDAIAPSRVTLVKIDVEGHELAVIEGAHHTLINDKPHLLIECENRHRDNAINSVKDLLASYGYAGYFYHRKRLHSISRFHESLQNPDALANFGDKTRNEIDYVNNFLFIHGGISPSSSLAHLLAN
jgi:FkbM family methyltransferase